MFFFGFFGFFWGGGNLFLFCLYLIRGDNLSLIGEVVCFFFGFFGFFGFFWGGESLSFFDIMIYLFFLFIC